MVVFPFEHPTHYNRIHAAKRLRERRQEDAKESTSFAQRNI